MCLQNMVGLFCERSTTKGDTMITQNTINQAELQAGLTEKFPLHFHVQDLKLSALAKRHNIVKSKGVEAFSVLLVLINLTFINKSIHHFSKYCRHELLKIGGKDVLYRLTLRTDIRWRGFLADLATTIIQRLERMSSWSDRVLVLDDTIIEKRGKRFQGLSWVFGHTIHKSVPEFNALVLGWSDRSSMIPFDFAMVGGKNRKGLKANLPNFDNRTIAHKRYEELGQSKLDLAKQMLAHAKRKGVDAGAVCFDTWFCWPKFVSSVVHEIGYDVVSRLKSTEKLTVVYKNKKYSTKRIWSEASKLRKKMVTVRNEDIAISSCVAVYGGVTVRLVFCEPTKKKSVNRPVILIASELGLSPEQVLETYSQRWAIEVMFKQAKQELFLGKYQSTSFQAAICMTTLSLARFAIIGYLERMENDLREKGSLFEKMKYEIETLNSLAFLDQFLSLLSSLMPSNINTWNILWEALSQVQDNIKESIEAFMFHKCET